MKFSFAPRIRQLVFVALGLLLGFGLFWLGGYVERYKAYRQFKEIHESLARVGESLKKIQPAGIAQFKYGTTEVDINRDGVKDLVTRVRWQNVSAHGYDKYLIAVKLGDEYAEVPLGKDHDYTFTTGEGAECPLTGYKFQWDGLGWLEIVEYKREPRSENYCEPGRVEVTTYRLTQDKDDVPPLFYFQPVDSYRTEEIYRDVKKIM